MAFFLFCTGFFLFVLFFFPPPPGRLGMPYLLRKTPTSTDDSLSFSFNPVLHRCRQEERRCEPETYHPLWRERLSRGGPRLRHPPLLPFWPVSVNLCHPRQMLCGGDTIRDSLRTTWRWREICAVSETWWWRWWIKRPCAALWQRVWLCVKFSENLDSRMVYTIFFHHLSALFGGRL